jgi:hypothetical protein
MGTCVTFVLKDGGEIDARKRDALLYDPSGRYWPRCSLLVAGFDRGGGVARDATKEARAFYGRSATIRAGTLEMVPPLDLSAWARLGPLESIFYERRGTKAPGYFRHEFNKPRGLWKLIFAIKGRSVKQPAVLYNLRSLYRVELPEGCIVDDRGIVAP